MGCCGEKLVHIAQGYASLGIEKLFKLEVMKSLSTDSRTRICHGCEKATWLSVNEYIAYLTRNGIEVINNLDDLAVLPELPINPKSKGTRLFCSVCKCYIPAKVRVDKEKCPLKKW